MKTSPCYGKSVGAGCLLFVLSFMGFLSGCATCEKDSFHPDAPGFVFVRHYQDFCFVTLSMPVMPENRLEIEWRSAVWFEGRCKSGKWLVNSKECNYSDVIEAIREEKQNTAVFMVDDFRGPSASLSAFRGIAKVCNEKGLGFYYKYPRSAVETYCLWDKVTMIDE